MASPPVPRAAGVGVSVPWGSAVSRLHVTAAVEAACPFLRLWHTALSGFVQVGVVHVCVRGASVTG